MTEHEALFAQALALEDGGRPAQALSHYRRILSADPHHEDAWHNHGLLLARLGRLQEAEQSHRDYLRLHPESARAANDLADVLLALSRYEEAIATLEPFPGDATALVRRGVALSCLRRFDEAREVFSAGRGVDAAEVDRFARHVAPGAALDVLLSPENIFLSRSFMALDACEWSGWSDYVREMRRAAVSSDAALEPAVGFMMLHLPLDDAERGRIARGIAARVDATVPILPSPGPRRPGRIRVGIVSPDFREHLIASVLLPLFELADRTRFEIHAYSLTPDDGSAIGARVRAAADGFHDLQAMDDAAAAALIRRHDIDVLLDVAGYTAGNRYRVLAQRPARVHASYLGFLGSLGSERIDFAIVDRVVAPTKSGWTEALAYLPHCFFLYDFRNAVPQTPLTRREYGLPEDAFVYCASHKAEKITPESFDLWMQVLRQVPRSVLWLRALSDPAMKNLRVQAAARGVDARRLVFAPFEPFSGGRYLARQRLGDLLLDAVHHNAITNACDALAAGLPMITVKGSAMTSRAGESLLRAAGLPELVAEDQADFVRLAVRLSESVQDIKAKLEDNRRTAPLFDTPARVRDLEACFEEMLQVSDQSRSRL